jgi:hypothetical protein
VKRSRVLALVLGLLLWGSTAAAADRAQRLVLVTIDGLRWQEVFRGADPTLAADKAVVQDLAAIKAAFLDPSDRAAALMPFLHGTMARQGVLFGDRDHGSCMAVTNDKWFSYPGYNEILTGRADPKIVSNAPTPNPNVTVLEWLNGRRGFAGKVRAVTSWDVFPAILNVARSKLPVNAGWATPTPRTPQEAVLGRVQDQTPQRWPNVRFDTFTQGYALESLKHDKPRVLYIAYGETDDFAHDGRYDQTLISARRTDNFLAELWAALQADRVYAGKTVMIVTTDHGRGAGLNPTDWKGHGKSIWPRSDETWFAAIGPGIGGPAKLEGCAGANQVAATALTALGIDWKGFDPKAGEPLAIFAR